VQLTVIVAVFMALLIGETANADNADGGTVWWMNHFNGLSSLAFVAGLVLLLWSLMQITCRSLLLRMERLVQQGNSTKAALRLPGRIDLLMRVLLIGAFGTQLTVGGWAGLTYTQWRLQRFVLVDEVVLLLPFMIMMFVKWYCFYPVSRFVREYIVAGQLVEGLPARPVWTRRQYMSFQMRHGMLIILIPLFLMLGFKDVVEQITMRWFSDGSVKAGLVSDNVSMMAQTVTEAGAAMIFICSPLLLRRIWLTRSLPGGPLRERLEAFCKQIKLGYRDILLWDTYSAVANAAVMGLLRPIRYVMLSDNLIENMADEQIEAVFGHEAGHVKHHHIMFLVLFVVGSISVMTLVVELTGLLLEGRLTEPRYFAGYDNYYDWFMYGFGIVLIVGWVLAFGWVSRKFERQADVYAAISVNPQDTDATLSEHGAYVMGSTLQRIAMLNGVSVDTRSFRHSSIISRMEFLRSLALQEGAMSGFTRQIVLTKVLIVLSVAVGVAGLWLLSYTH